MESSHVFGDREKQSSSESGWTMYLSSPMHHEEEDYSDENDDDDDGDANGYEDGREDSDDSLASDASSGPSRPEHHHHPFGNDNDNMAHIKHDRRQHNKIMFCSYTKPFKQMDKKRSEGASKVEEDEDNDEVMEATSPTTVHQSGSKIRKKTNRMARRK